LIVFVKQQEEDITRASADSWAQVRAAPPAVFLAPTSGAQASTKKFVRWYNHEHKHDGLKFVTPAQRHGGQAAAILQRLRRRDNYVDKRR
jgi:transposase InsO family protein